MTEGKKAKIIQLLKEVQPKAPMASKAKSGMSIVGNGNIQAGGDIHVSPRVVNKTVVKTGDGTIDAAQKFEIQRLVAKWREDQNAVRKKPMSFAAAWGAFNSAMGINSYHELPMESFNLGRAWLMKQSGIISGMASAPKKLPGWRNTIYSYIKAACKNDIGNPDAYRPYIAKNFGATSLTNLSDNELQQTKQYVAGLKKSAKVRI